MKRSKLACNTAIFLGTICLLSNYISIFPPPASAQTLISGDVVGTITDGTGAVVPGATVQIHNVDTGESKSTMTNATGDYRVAFVKPGNYSVIATGGGFKAAVSSVTVTAGQIAQADVKLTLGDSSQTVEVSGAAPLLQTQSADLSTSFSEQQVQSLPNPGGDMSFVAQIAPGSVMNTAGGVGNFASFGLPSVANTFTVNGSYENDPFLGNDVTGAAGLLLGNNDISEVSVISNAYSAQYGGLAGAQINEISRSGTNLFHGNARYLWNGSSLNANDYFNKQAGNVRPFDNANQYAASFGGPIFKDKTFFFLNLEGLRLVLPVTGPVFAPSPSFQSTTLGAVPVSERPFFQQLFGVYSSNPRYSTAIADPNDSNAVVFQSSTRARANEWLMTGRVDHNLSASDNLFLHFYVDHGTAPFYTDKVSSLFNAVIQEPVYQAQLNENHVFSPRIVNQFVLAGIYQPIFIFVPAADATTLVPFQLGFSSGDLANTSLGGADSTWPQGRDLTGYQVIDDVSLDFGRHSIKTGVAYRRDDISDYDPRIGTTPSVTTSEASFASGIADSYNAQFPTRLEQPIAFYTLAGYIQDQWKVLPKLVLTSGIRIEHNSNPVCLTRCFAHLSSDFSSLPTDQSTSYNKLITSGQSQAFRKLQPVAYEPRIGFAYSPLGEGTKTVVRGGFGYFASSFPGQIADSLLNNVPTSLNLVVNGGRLAPTSAGSSASLAAASNVSFQGAYPTGGSYTSIVASSPLFSGNQPNFFATSTNISMPTYLEWSLFVDQQVSKSDSFSIGYVGNRGYHGAIIDPTPNAYGFGSLPTAAPNPNFHSVPQVNSDATSNYNGLSATATHRTKSLTITVNYAWSHALDEISNGGVQPFNGANTLLQQVKGNLHANYGNADYDERQYLSGGYVYTIPHFGGPRVLTAGWQISGTVFHGTGLPFTPTDSSNLGSIFNNNFNTNFGPRTLIPFASGHSTHTHCGGSAAANGTPCAFAGDFAAATDFGQTGRNQLFGPNYSDTDLSIEKAFDFPRWEKGKLKVGAQFFNLANHVNFGQPVSNYAAGNFGAIISDVNTPTSILGSGLGASADPRLIQLKGELTF